MSIGSFIGSTLGSLTGADDAAEAAREGQRLSLEAQERMAEKSEAFQREMWDWQKEQAAPWTTAGLGALGQYQEQMGAGFAFDPSTDPVYQARLGEQSKAFGASGAARGMQLSGGTLRGLRDITATELGSSYGRQRGEYQQRLANLGNIMNVGQGRGMNLAGMGQQFTQGVTGTMGQLGQAQSQYHQNIGQIGAQQATSGFNTLMGMGQLGASMYGAGMFDEGNIFGGG